MDQLRPPGPLKILIAGLGAEDQTGQHDQDRLRYILKTNIEHWGYEVVILPPEVGACQHESVYEGDILLYDLDEAFHLSSLIGGKDSPFYGDMPQKNINSFTGYSESVAYRNGQRPLAIALSTRTVSRTTLEAISAVAVLQKPFEMKRLQRYLRIMQRLLCQESKMVAVPSQKTNKCSKFRILVVDDDAAVANVIQQCLVSEDRYEVEVAYDGLEALERCLDWSPQCIVTDLIMPWMNGYQVIHCLSASVQAGSLAVMPAFVVISALTQLEVPINRPYLKDKVVYYVDKPFTIDKLLSAIAQACTLVA